MMAIKETLFKVDKNEERNLEQKNIENLKIVKDEIEQMLKVQLEIVKSKNTKKRDDSKNSKCFTEK